MSMSSIIVIWILANQYRLYMLLILSDAYLPQKIVDYIKGGKLFSFNFSFLPIQELSVVKEGLDNIKFPQTDSSLEAIGLESGSAIANNLNLVVTVLLIVMAHLLFRLIEKVLLRKVLLLMNCQ
mmetsp:Transcript_5351/g.6381  ORF Transcript_5351/g.6381 Transcript_5351/m.6381 type:complete len:124 (-) Transcript_5351:17-388(-)